ncbi:hypothetical protein NMY22_g13844 [Coprinellus aureogranulatus]|nr:hypothetical protein NMY22_g13844 [Coprinellus aureogranulatus]
MPYSQEQIEAVTQIVYEWRLQENIQLPFFIVYVYAFWATLEEEVSNFASKQGKTGKLLYLLLKHGTLTQIIVYFVAAYPKPITEAISVLARRQWVNDDLNCGRGAGAVYFRSARTGASTVPKPPMSLLASLCHGQSLPMAYFIIRMICYAGIDPEPISTLDRELGYPCSIPSTDGIRSCYPGGNTAVLSYFNFARALVLTMFAVVTLLVRRRYYQGRLADVVSLDGGLYYFGCAALRLVYAITTTPSIFTFQAWLSKRHSKVKLPPLSMSLLFDSALSVPKSSNEVTHKLHLSIVAIPLLVQRLLLRISKVGTVGAMPPGSIASSILFASDTVNPYEDRDE